MAIKVVIYRDEATKNYILVPAITVETTGAYRPYVQAAELIGEEFVHTKGGVSNGGVNGVTLYENGYIPLSGDAIDLLAGGSVHTIRLEGKNTSYEVNTEFDTEKLAAFMEACKVLTIE